MGSVEAKVAFAIMMAMLVMGEMVESQAAPQVEPEETSVAPRRFGGGMCCF